MKLITDYGGFWPSLRFVLWPLREIIFHTKAQKAFKRGTGVVLCSGLMLFASCVKQHNCDCNYTGTLSSDTIYIDGGGLFFIENKDIPKKFRSEQPVKISFCYEKRYSISSYPESNYIKLKCIEEIKSN